MLQVCAHMKCRGGGSGRGRPRNTKGADGTELEAQELPDDIYEGEQDDALRPAKPGQVSLGEHDFH